MAGRKVMASGLTLKMRRRQKSSVQGLMVGRMLSWSEQDLTPDQRLAVRILVLMLARTLMPVLMVRRRRGFQELVQMGLDRSLTAQLEWRSHAPCPAYLDARLRLLLYTEQRPRCHLLLL